MIKASGKEGRVYKLGCKIIEVDPVAEMEILFFFW